MLSKILDERPENPADIIENISKDMKCARFQKKLDTLRDEYERHPSYELAEMFKTLFQRGGGGSEGTDQELEEEMVSNCVAYVTWKTHCFPFLSTYHFLSYSTI